MAKYLLLLLFLSSYLCASESYAHHSINSVKIKDTNCTKIGYKCSSDCSKLELCMPKGSDFSSTDLIYCDSGTWCDEDNINNIVAHNSCSSTPNQCPVPFTCTSDGVFPDPYDCRQFHVCVANSPDIRVTCNTGYAFDTSTGQCSLKVTDNPALCTYGQVPKCINNGQCGSLRWSSNFYYNCEDGIAAIYKCESGWLDCTTLKCTDVTSSTTASTVSPICNSSTIYEDPEDCSSYYLCKRGSAPQHKHCPAGNSYNHVLGMCLVDSRICGNASTCEVAGLYPDLLNCNFYYLCLRNIAPKHEKCDINYRFDARLGLCVPGTCD